MKKDKKKRTRDITPIKQNSLYIIGKWGCPEKISLFGINQFGRWLFIRDVQEKDIEELWLQAEKVASKNTTK